MFPSIEITALYLIVYNVSRHSAHACVSLPGMTPERAKTMHPAPDTARIGYEAIDIFKLIRRETYKMTGVPSMGASFPKRP